MKILIIIIKLFIICIAVITAVIFITILFTINNICRNCLNKLSNIWKKIKNGSINRC